MKNQLLLFCLIFLVSACANDTSLKTTVLVNATEPRTRTPQPSLTATQFVTATQENRATQIEKTRLTKTAQANLTATINALTPTRLPKVTFAPKPTNSPTPTHWLSPTPPFDVSSVVTRTPAPAALCPPENPELTTDLDTLFTSKGWKLNEEAMLDFLNEGGMPQAIIEVFLQEALWFEEDLAIQQDITGDNVPEFIFSDEWVVRVFGCKEGKYELLLGYTEDPAGLRSIRISVPGDMNLNGVPELITNAQRGHSNVDHYVTIFEWSGEQLASIVQGESYAEGQYFSSAIMTGVTQVTTSDIDGNGILELILDGSPPIETTSSYQTGLPWRNETHIYAWNGDLFVLDQVVFSPPEYRFQAVQDGDRASLYGNYEQAEEFYQQTISNDLLEWWSEERLIYEIRNLSLQAGETLLQTPVPELTEYPNLAAYAHYRIMLLHILRKNLIEAENEFNILKTSYQPNQSGFAYVELATVFWHEFKKSAKIEAACAEAIEYTKLHPGEVLPFLGNGDYAGAHYFGFQSLEYEPEDVCPFH